MDLNQKKISIADDCLVQQMGDGMVIMNLKTEHFYELDAVGKRFWELSAEHSEIQKALNILQEEYDVSPEILKNDILQLIESLVKAQIVEVYDI